MHIHIDVTVEIPSLKSSLVVSECYDSVLDTGVRVYFRGRYLPKEWMECHGLPFGRHLFDRLFCNEVQHNEE